MQMLPIFLLTQQWLRQHFSIIWRFPIFFWSQQKKKGAHFQCNCQCHGWLIIDWIPGLIFFSFLRWLLQAFHILCYFMNLFFLDLSLNKRARLKSYHVLQPRCLPQERATSLRWHWDYLEAITMAVYLLRLFYFLFLS